jgi:hypothetical protein
MNVGGNWDLTGGDLTSTNSTIIFDGTLTQSITTASETYSTIEIRNTTNVVTFADSFTTANFTIDSDNYAGTVEVDFEESLTYTITGTLTLDGASGEEITLDSQNGSTRFYLDIQAATNMHTM